jgi:hypothetical protein
MFLGIFYHWQFVSGGMGMMGGGGPKAAIDHWLHSFRMPLFFLISGFFAAMMLGRHGVLKYLGRRWWRVGMPLLVSILLFAGWRFAQSYFPWAAAPVPGMGNFGGMGGFGGGGAGGGGFGAPAGNPFGPGAGPGGGGNPFGPGGAPGGNPFGPQVPGGGGNVPGAPNFGGGMPGFQPGGFPGGPGAPAGGGRGQTPAVPAVAPMPEVTSPFSFGGPPHPWADWIFGKLNLHAKRADGRVVTLTAMDFQLQHLWFLWYLLIFCTVAPLITVPLGMVMRGERPVTDRIGEKLLRWDLLPLVLAAVTMPALLHAKGYDWQLMNPGGFSGVFPDFLAQYFADLPFYFLYFLFGWWFFRLRRELDAIGRPWLLNLTLGVAAFAIARSLNGKYNAMPAFGFGFGMPGASQGAAPEWARLTAFGLCALGAAYSGFGLLGLFQKYLDRPTRFGKYFTDTMLWIYLVQLALIPYVANWVDYNNTSWWEATLAGMAVVTGLALVMFELFIRHTPLVHVFGPASLAKKRG